MIQRDVWHGVLASVPPIPPAGRLRAPLRPSSQGATGAFLGLASDGRRYWVKVANNPVGKHVLVKEQIVGRAGALIGAPTCPVITVEIPDAVVGWEFRPGRTLERGVGHGSMHIEGGIDTRRLSRQTEDDNAARYTAFVALYDWCWGHDWQGVHVVQDEARFFCFDYDWYLPPGGQQWDGKCLLEYVDTPHPVPDAPVLATAAALRIAERLEQVSRAELAHMLRHVPGEWGVPDRDLEDVGFYLERRAPQVAARLREEAGGGR